MSCAPAPAEAASVAVAVAGGGDAIPDGASSRPVVFDWAPVRIRGSEVAACAGVHPYAEIDELFANLVYQGDAGALALALDAAELGAVVESRDEAVERLVGEIASTATRKALRHALRDATAAGTDDVRKVDRVVRRATATLRGAVARREVDARAAATLQAHAGFLARTEFGRREERRALEEYERRTGTEVVDRNDRLLTWDFFATAPSGAEEHSSSETPADESSSSSSSSEAAADAPQATPREVLFRVVGKIDGVAHEVDCGDADPERWTVRPVVVEVKHRISRCAVPAPLHDQLQLVTYMLMTGADRGDLVQCVRRSRRREGGGDGVVDEQDQDDASWFRVDRVDVARHRTDWDTIVVPRLRMLARAVDALRRDSSRRLAFVAASPRDRWLAAVALCDWLPDPPLGYEGRGSLGFGVSSAVSSGDGPQTATAAAAPAEEEDTAVVVGGGGGAPSSLPSTASPEEEPPRWLRHDRVDATRLDGSTAFAALPAAVADALRRRLPGGKESPRWSSEELTSPEDARRRATVSGGGRWVSDLTNVAALDVGGDPPTTQKRRRRATIGAEVRYFLRPRTLPRRSSARLRAKRLRTEQGALESEE